MASLGIRLPDGRKGTMEILSSGYGRELHFTVEGKTASAYTITGDVGEFARELASETACPG